MDLNPQRNQLTKAEKSNLLSKVLRALVSREKKEAYSINNLNESRELLNSIKNARIEWVSANMNFEFAIDQDLIDYYTYKIKACEVRYEYLIKRAKERGLKVEFIEAGMVRLNESRAGN